MKEKTCCFTGHRAISNNKIKPLRTLLRAEITELIDKGYTRFLAGGALGFDTLAAIEVLSLKKLYPHIELVLIFPYKDQTRGWSTQNVELYEKIKLHCDSYIYVEEEYSIPAIFKRNRLLVDNSSICISYLTRNTGGTAYTANYAREQGIEVINLASVVG